MTEKVAGGNWFQINKEYCEKLDKKVKDENTGYNESVLYYYIIQLSELAEGVLDDRFRDICYTNYDSINSDKDILQIILNRIYERWEYIHGYGDTKIAWLQRSKGK